MPGLDDIDPYGTVPHRGWRGAVHRLTHDLGDSTWRGRAWGSTCKPPFSGFLQATPLGCGGSDDGPHTPSSAGGRLRNVPRPGTAPRPGIELLSGKRPPVAADANTSTFQSRCNRGPGSPGTRSDPFACRPMSRASLAGGAAVRGGDRCKGRPTRHHAGQDRCVVRQRCRRFCPAIVMQRGKIHGFVTLWFVSQNRLKSHPPLTTSSR